MDEGFNVDGQEGFEVPSPEQLSHNHAFPSVGFTDTLKRPFPWRENTLRCY